MRPTGSGRRRSARAEKREKRVSKDKSGRTVISAEGRVLPGVQIESSGWQNVRTAGGDGQQPVREVGQQAGHILEELYAAGIRRVLVMARLILVAFLAVVMASLLLMAVLRRRVGGCGGGHRRMGLTRGCGVAQAESQAIEIGDGCQTSEDSLHQPRRKEKG